MVTPIHRAFALSAAIAAPLAAHAQSASAPATVASAPEARIEIVGRALRMDDARNSIQTQTGASAYQIDQSAIAAMPAGANAGLNQVLLQAPEVAQDSFGQFHVRGEHNGVQYRVNGVVLPEGIAGFGQSFDPRLISSVSLITGALPAEYGLRTAGIIDIKTKSGAADPGGSISLYGGSHGTIQPSANVAGGSGNLSWFVSADALRNDLGIESPDGGAKPIHDRTTQFHGFGYLDDVLDDRNRVGLMFGTATGRFQIPNRAGLQPDLGLAVGGVSGYDSAALNENQREITDFAALSWLHADGALAVQTSLVARGSSLAYDPDWLGDLLFNGIAQQATKKNSALALQSDGSYKLDARHTLRGGLYLQGDRSTSSTTAHVLPVDALGNPTSGQPLLIADDSAKSEQITSLYLQDEYKPVPSLTFNYGLRYDGFSAYTHGHQFSPRLNVVWEASPALTLHGGYARYFSPPPFELVGSETVSKFVGTTAAPAVGRADTPQAERAHYLDLGAQLRLSSELGIGIDAYYKQSRHLIDEGQFGAPIILTPFNYRDGRQSGLELSLDYAGKALSGYANIALQSARGRGIESAQFNFPQAELDYIAAHYIDLDHAQRITGAAGLSYQNGGTRFSGDLTFGSGLRASLTLSDGSEIPNGTHLPFYTQLNLGVSHEFKTGVDRAVTLRLDVINALDRRYEIRNGSGVGVGAPQFGARRGVFAGITFGF
ncbi:MAG: TonB-dependent receptor [Burkholderiales bacterium]|nr:TonB-dependent receptor [Burkholderiales bacterium]